MSIEKIENFEDLYQPANFIANDFPPVIPLLRDKNGCCILRGHDPSCSELEYNIQNNFCAKSDFICENDMCLSHQTICMGPQMPQSTCETLGWNTCTCYSRKKSND